MRFDGRFADVQFVRDLYRRTAFSDKLQNFSFAPGQRFFRRAGGFVSVTAVLVLDFLRRVADFAAEINFSSRQKERFSLVKKLPMLPEKYKIPQAAAKVLLQ